ncbi:hypothetical protein HII31_09074 [Pseudocercospora fuligena]|uniref:Uncharacterized protein n=1 Tax=Pseudocercospora fuligena TaxID=685502 RepID=A0A8H6RD23_9PEZI|nr:hypothetical protein HII31_09074 [Pseudocercospora fuligena]
MVSSPIKGIRLIKASSPTKKAMSPRKVRFQRRAVPGKSCLKKASVYSPIKRNAVSSPSKIRSLKPVSKNVKFATPSKIQVLIIPAENRGRRVKNPHSSVRLLSPEKQHLDGVEEQVESAKVRTSATKKLKKVVKMFRSWKQAGAANEKRASEILGHTEGLAKTCSQEERLLLRKPMQSIILEIEKLSEEEKKFLELVEMARIQKQAKEKTVQQADLTKKEKPKSLAPYLGGEDELVKGLTKQFKAVNIDHQEQPATPADVVDRDSLQVLMVAEQRRELSQSTTRADQITEMSGPAPPKMASTNEKLRSADEDDGGPKWWHPIVMLLLLTMAWAARHD